MDRKQFLQVAGGSVLLLASQSGILPSNALAARRKPASTFKYSYTKYRLKLKHTWTIARGSNDFKEIVVVKIEKDGIVGIGESAPTTRYKETPDSSMNFLKAAEGLIKNSDLYQFHELDEKIHKLSGEYSAKAALDMAILDWVGKKLNLPLYKLLGLNKAKTPITSFSIGIDKPDVVKQKVLEAADFPLLKIKVGYPDDKEMVDAVRSVTDKKIRVDANEGWQTKEEAVEKINWLASMGVEFVEQPMAVDKLEDMKWVKQQVKIPLIADENVKTAKDIPSIVGAYDGINIKLMKCGGIQEALRMIAVARSLNLKIMLGCMIESSLAITAAAHISPLIDYADLDGNLLISNDPFTKGVKVEKGKLILPDTPGLGVA